MRTVEQCTSQQCLSRAVKTILDIGSKSQDPFEDFQNPIFLLPFPQIFDKHYGEFCSIIINKYLPTLKKKQIMILGQFFMALTEAEITPSEIIKNGTNFYYKLSELKYKAELCGKQLCKDVKGPKGWGLKIDNETMINILASKL